ncbi:TetR/AcrR family transcriptional regulator [Brachybacterium huguangmaarense]
MNTVNSAGSTYHHGHLREELVRIGVELAAEGGPEAIGIREASRRAGVSPAAAYRHFAGQGELREAVRAVAVERLAEHVASDAAVLPPGAGPRERLASLGRAYIGFALAEPQLFRCLTGGFVPAQGGTDAADGAEDPFDRLLRDVARASGRSDACGEEQLADAIALLAAAHGFATLAVGGLLRGTHPERLAVLRERTLAVAIAGLDAAGSAEVGDGAERET